MTRLKDWLYGIVQSHPGGVKNAIVDGAFEAEDILSVYHLVNWPKTNGGAGITPGWGQWENVESIFPLHNEATNLALLGQLSSRLFLTSNDLDQIRNLFGTKVPRHTLIHPGPRPQAHQLEFLGCLLLCLYPDLCRISYVSCHHWSSCVAVPARLLSSVRRRHYRLVHSLP